MDDFLLFQHAPQPVGAQHDGVAVDQCLLAAQLDFGLMMAAQTVVNLVLFCVMQGFLFRDQPGIDHFLHFGMIFGLRHHLPVAD